MSVKISANMQALKNAHDNNIYWYQKLGVDTASIGETINKYIELTTEVLTTRRNGRPWLPVEYIQSSGTQYIDTKHIHNTDLWVTMDVAFSAPVGQYGFFYGSRVDVGSVDSFTYFIDKASGKIGARISGNSTNNMCSANYGNKSNVRFSKVNFVFNEARYATVSSGLTNGVISDYIFAVNQGGIAMNFASMKLYKLIVKEYRTGVISPIYRIFIPVILVDDITAEQDSEGIARSIGTVGLWELCDNKFYGNKGTGTFSYGA